MHNPWLFESMPSSNSSMPAMQCKTVLASAAVMQLQVMWNCSMPWHTCLQQLPMIPCKLHHWRSWGMEPPVWCRCYAWEPCGPCAGAATTTTCSGHRTRHHPPSRHLLPCVLAALAVTLALAGCFKAKRCQSTARSVCCRQEHTWPEHAWPSTTVPALPAVLSPRPRPENCNTGAPCVSQLLLIP